MLQKVFTQAHSFSFLQKDSCSYCHFMHLHSFIFLIGGRKEHVCPFYVVDELTSPLSSWPMWCHVTQYMQSKGEPTTSKQQHKAIELYSLNSCCYLTYLETSWTKGFSLILYRRRRGQKFDYKGYHEVTEKYCFKKINHTRLTLVLGVCDQIK